jgi:hypothetical protein
MSADRHGVALDVMSTRLLDPDRHGTRIDASGRHGAGTQHLGCQARRVRCPRGQAAGCDPTVEATNEVT